MTNEQLEANTPRTVTAKNGLAGHVFVWRDGNSKGTIKEINGRFYVKRPFSADWEALYAIDLAEAAREVALS